jgi:hypothetical protein
MRQLHTITLAAILAVGVTPITVGGQPVTGNDLLERCDIWDNFTDMSSAFESGMCQGELFGVWNTASILNHLPSVQARLLTFCSPEEVTLLRIRRIVVNYLQAHPERLQESSSILILDALREAFPCP